MSSSVYEGLTIEFGGDTTNVLKALRNVKKEAQGSTKELRQLQNALKVDPENADLMAQRQEVLKTKIKEATDKLEIYKKLEDQPPKEADSKFWSQLYSDIARAEQSLEKYKKELAKEQAAPGLEAAQRAVKNTREELEKLDKALELNPGNTDLIEQKQGALKRAIKASRDELDEYKNLAKAVNEGNLDYTESEWSDLKVKINEAESALKNYEEEQERLAGGGGGELAGAKSNIQDMANKFGNVSRKVSNFGDNYTRTVTVGMVGAAAAAVKSVVGMDDALTDVRKTVDGTEEDYENLKDAAIEFSQTNAVEPETILELDALGAQLGFLLPELEKFGKVSSGLDIATNMSAEDAATEMAHFANIMGMTHDDIDRYASTVVQLGNTTATTESDISEMAQRIAGAGKAIGLSSADVLGLAAALSSLGIEAEAGGSAISTIMSSIDKAVAGGTDRVRDYAAQAGMSVEEFVDALRKDGEQLEAIADSQGVTVSKMKSEVKNASKTLQDFSSAIGISQEDLINGLQNSPEQFEEVAAALGTTVDQMKEDVESSASTLAQWRDASGMNTDELIRLFDEDGKRFEELAQANGMSCSDLKDQVLDSIDTLETWADTAGMSAEAFAEAWKTNPGEALQAVLTGIQTSVDEGGNLSLLLEDLGVDAIRQQDVMKRLAGSGDLMKETIENANAAWEENTALTKEVENRNSSMSSQFQILKNRVKKLAIEVGEPLAKALMEALDAMEPLFNAIEDGAEAFASMSKEEQEAVLKAAGAVAAFGPLLSIVGRVGGGVAGAMETFGALGEKLVGVSGAVTATGEAAATTTGLAAGLTGGLVALMGAAVGVCGALAVKEFLDYNRELENAAEATKDLTDLQDAAKGTIDDHKYKINEATGEIEELTGSYRDAIDAADETMGKIAESNREFQAKMEDIEGKAGVADAYLDKIEELTGKTTLTKEEQLKLNAAVEGYNKVTGENLEVIDATNGKLNKSTRELRRNTEAWKLNLEVQAYQDLYNDTIRQRIELEQDLADVDDELDAALDAYADASAQLAEQQTQGFITAEYYSATLEGAAKPVAELQQKHDQLTAALEAMRDKESQCEQAITDTNEEIYKSEEVVKDLYGVFDQWGDEVNKHLEDAGFDLDEFCDKMADTGKDAGTLKNITSDQFEQLYNECGGDLDLLMVKLDEMNEFKLQEKQLQVSTMSLEEVYTWLDEINDMTLQEKELIVRTKIAQDIGYDFVGPVMTSGHAAGALIQKHAAGAAIISQPTQLGRHLYGESGDEVVLPFDNPRYMKPIARGIASYMDAAAGTTYNLYIDGTQWNDKQLTADTVADFVTEIARKGDMNCG